MPATSDDDASQIFRKDGRPLSFAIHESIQSEELRAKLLDQVESHGGEIYDDDVGVDFVLFNHRRHARWNQHHFQHSYNTHPDVTKRGVVVLAMTYVDQCVRNGRLVPLPERPRYRMPGIPVGSRKIPFTEEDELNLCNYLTLVVPDEDAGGRQAIGLYEEMVAKPEYDLVSEWVLRHSAESWRTYYKKHKERIDHRVRELAAILDRDPNARYIRDRRLNAKRTIEEDDDAADEAEERLTRGQRIEEPIRARRNNNRTRTGRQNRARSRSSEREDDAGGHLSTDADENQLQYADDPVAPPRRPQPRASSSQQAARANPATTSRNLQRTQRFVANTASRPPQSSPTLIGSSQFSAPSRSKQPIEDDNNPVPPTPSQESQPEPQPESQLEVEIPPASSQPNILVPSTSSPSRPSRSQPLRTKAARRPRATPAPLPETTEPSTIYRNTRARSRPPSAEPQHDIASAAVAQKRKPGRPQKIKQGPKAAKKPQLEPESNLNPAENTPVTQPPPAFVLEGIPEDSEHDARTDEMEVEPAVDEVMNMTLGGQYQPSAPSPRSSRKRKRSVDIEDQQLQGRLGNGLGEEPAKSHTMAGAILQSLLTRGRAPSPSTVQSRTSRSSAPSLKREMRNFPALVQLQAGPSRMTSGQSARNPGLMDPAVVDFRGRERERSESDSGEFPISGTKAHEVKKKIQEREKRTPYKPPAGTKAAQLSGQN
ncbi:hypothetical protein K435DRAFT_959279 [Dendrothele bispora CBS 962.96]|uniref:Uncharacterized protein n=1 Tax=Dendrothele bispora (strain CBS 962.96) TaxID=1314807 RepID=A0A4S8MX61_DENBC|nr:hypothetical protein K435DRAFT_959279 [Dendrothele bispora CBS 962.96]